MLRRLFPLVTFFFLFVTPNTSSHPPAPGDAPQLLRWRAAEGAFASWELHDVELTEQGALRLVAAGSPSPSNPAFGEAISPVMEGISFEEAIPSWNAETPASTWMDVLLRVRPEGGEWSGWYNLGIWTAETGGVVQRQSVDGQEDAIARVATDTLVMRAGRADAVQLKLRLLSAASGALPAVRTVGLALSDHPDPTPVLSPGNPERWGRSLQVAACSQMAYPDGGEAWCSPTSVAMVLRYWAEQAGQEVGPCEPWVRAAVAGVYDFVYDGHGNWPFNVAYAATHGLEGYVVRLRNLEEAETWIARGVPLVVSFSWRPGELDGAPLPASAGHLAVLSGFDGQGNPIFHDPAGFPDSEVRRTYRRDQFERLWLSRTAGTAYLIAPPETFAPPYHLFVPVATRRESGS